MSKKTHFKRLTFFKVGTITGIVFAVLALVIVVAFLVSTIHFAPIPPSTDSTPPKSDGSSDGGGDTSLVQCRVDAVVAYMTSQQFKDGEYVIGEENVDFQDPAVLQTGSLAFGKDGANVTSRVKLQAVFDSHESALQHVIDAQVAKFPSVQRSILLDAQNWEVVQTKIATQINGNTGLINNQSVNMGTRESPGGDAAWLFINPETCVVPNAEVQPTNVDINEPPAVGLIRVGCINPGNGLRPKDWSLNVGRPDGVTPQGGDAEETRPGLPASPAPVIPSTTTSTSGSQAPGATTPDPNRNIPATGTGTKPDGSEGSVNPSPGPSGPGVNQGDPGNPFG